MAHGWRWIFTYYLQVIAKKKKSYHWKQYLVPMRQHRKHSKMFIAIFQLRFSFYRACSNKMKKKRRIKYIQAEPEAATTHFVTCSKGMMYFHRLSYCNGFSLLYLFVKINCRWIIYTQLCSGLFRGERESDKNLEKVEYDFYYVKIQLHSIMQTRGSKEIKTGYKYINSHTTPCDQGCNQRLNITGPERFVRKIGCFRRLRFRAPWSWRVSAVLNKQMNDFLDKRLFIVQMCLERAGLLHSTHKGRSGVLSFFFTIFFKQVEFFFFLKCLSLSASCVASC